MNRSIKKTFAWQSVRVLRWTQAQPRASRGRVARGLAMAFVFFCGLENGGIALAAQTSDIGSGGAIGFLGGMAFGGGGGPETAYEFKASYHLVPWLVASIYYLGASTSLSVNDAGVTDTSSISNQAFGLEGLYPLPSGVMAGAKLGLMKFSPTVQAGKTGISVTDSNSYSSLAVAPTLAYDWYLGNGFSMGGELSYFVPFSSSISKMLTLLVSLKLHF